MRLHELLNDVCPFLKTITLRSNRAEEKRRGCRIFRCRQAGRSTGTAFSQLIRHRIWDNIDDQRWEHRTLLAVRNHLNLAVGDRGNGMLLHWFYIVLSHRIRNWPQTTMLPQLGKTCLPWTCK